MADTFVTDWWADDAAYSMDACRKRSVQEVQRRVGRVELWCGLMGNILIWKAALVRTLQY